LSGTRVSWAVLIGAASLAGCASTPAVRGLAGGTGRYVQSLQDGTAAVVEAQNRMNRINEQRLASLDLAGERARTGVRQQRLVWSGDGSAAALAAFDRATAPSAEMVVGDLDRLAVAAPQVGMPAASGYEKALRSLADVRTGPGGLDALTELLAFGQGTKAKYDELQAEVAEKTVQAADAAPTAPQ